MRIGTVIVHFRFWPDFAGTLDALLGQTRPPDDIVVVDDRSGDGSVDAIRAAYPDVEVIEAPENRGVIANFDEGVALMLERGVDAVLMLTHETLLDRGALATLAERLEDEPRLGEVGPLIGFLSRPGVVFSAGGSLDARTWANPHIGMYERLDARRDRGPHAVAWLDGACVLVRAAALRDVGALERRYFHYYDDVHVGVRLNQLGWGVECQTDALAWQEPGALAEYYRVRNRLGWLRATAPRRVLNRALAGYAHRLVLDLRTGTPEGRALAVAIVRGARDFALGRWGRAPAAYGVAKRGDDPSIGGTIAHVPAVEDRAPVRATAAVSAR